jgi:RNA polymerase sporulation-specific sigma factor
MIKKFITYLLNLLKTDDNIFFVGSADKLPEPLSKEKESEFLEIVNGEFSDFDKKEATEKLIEHNLRLVVFLSKKFENTGIDLEDLVSIGTIGLIKGVNTYKPNKNIKLATYASRCIDNEILMYLRKNKKRKSEVSFEDNLSYDSEGNELHLEDILGTDFNIVAKELEEENDKRLLYEEIEKLPLRDKQIMILRYGLFDKEEMTQKDVAKLLNISQSYISRIEKKVIKRIRNLAKT